MASAFKVKSLRGRAILTNEQLSYFHLVKNVNKNIFSITFTFRALCCVFIAMLSPSTYASKVPVHALYIPLADHYAGIVAYERYRNTFQHADFSIEQMPNWDFLQAKFLEGKADMAFVMSPLAMDMFAKKPEFRWIGLMHRDGNALAVNKVLLKHMNLSPNRGDRKPDQAVANALKIAAESNKGQTLIGMPHLLSTHTVVLYQYLKTHGLSLSLIPNTGADVLAISVAPPKSPVFLKSQANRAFPAAFEQSLPWADIVETQGYGKVAWYSKDVIDWPRGHVECITIASDEAIASKSLAIKEVMDSIHLAGQDIENARLVGGAALDEIVTIIQKHIPAHTVAAIKASLDVDLQVINYKNLNVDVAGLRLIMDIALEGKILQTPIDIEDFVHTEYSFDSQAAETLKQQGSQ